MAPLGINHYSQQVFLGLSRKSLCFFFFFRAKLQIRQHEAENAITLKRLKVETSNLELRWGTYKSFFVQILRAIGHMIRVSELKTKTPIGGLDSSITRKIIARVSNFRSVWANSFSSQK